MKTKYPAAYSEPSVDAVELGYVKAHDKTGKVLPDYKVELVFSTPHPQHGPVVMIFQPIGDTWYMVGAWGIKTLLQDPGDALFIDAGQGWYVTGLLSILERAEILWKERGK